MSRCCFGVEPCSDGSVVIAARDDEEVSLVRLEAGNAQSAEVVEFVRARSRSPRVCVASYNGRGLNLALAFGALPDAEVILTRPELLGPANGRGATRGEPLAVALASYARRAA
jgi:hypothetical protein